MSPVPEEGMIYLACAYTDASAHIMDVRYEHALKYTALLLKQGHIIYSPVVHCHELAKTYDLPKDAAFWSKYNFAMLKLAHALWIIDDDDERWRLSSGVGMERAFADIMQIPAWVIRIDWKTENIELFAP